MTNKPSSTDRSAYDNVDVGKYRGVDDGRPVGDDELVARLRHTRIVTLNGQSGPVPLNPDGPEAADRITDLTARLERYREALDRAMDFVVDVINEAPPGSIHHTNAVKCHDEFKALSDGEG